jgi:acyl transferase domain-containing protein
VSAFGFGGTNFHCVLEEAEPDSSEVAWDGDVQIVAISGSSAQATRQALESWPAEPAWDDLRRLAARSRQEFRGEDPHRLLIVIEREGVAWAQLRDQALAQLGGSTAKPGLESVYVGAGSPSGALAVLFPGQGAQYVGMLRDLACRFPEARRVLEAASLAERDAGKPLGDWIYPHPSFDAAGREAAASALKATAIAQPALGAVSLGAYRVLERFGIRPKAFAGHSFGELTALCASERITEADFFALARRRGRLMAEGEGSDRGGMLAVLAPLDEIEATMAREQLDLVVANRNAPRQAVVSGASSEIARAEGLFQAAGLTCRRLEVSAAFHSRFVAEASRPLLETLASVPFQEGSAPVFANATASPYPSDPQEARALLASQLARPVLFVDQVEAMVAAGVRTFLEVGPDARLTGLVRSIVPGSEVTALALDTSKAASANLSDLARALAKLASLGHAVDLARWDEGILDRQPPARKPGLTVKVSGANFTPKPSARPSRALGNGSLPKPPSPSTAPAPPTSPLFAPMSPTPPPASPRASAPSHVSAQNGSVAQGNGHTHAPLPGRPTPEPANPSVLTDALRQSRENLSALQKLGEQTADLHRRFLDGQERTQRSSHWPSPARRPCPRPRR